MMEYSTQSDKTPYDGWSWTEALLAEYIYMYLYKSH